MVGSKPFEQIDTKFSNFIQDFSHFNLRNFSYSIVVCDITFGAASVQVVRPLLGL